MKSNATSLVVRFAMSLFPTMIATTVPGCDPASRQAARTAIDVGLAACLAERADIEDEVALREVCKWADDLAPIVKDLLAARRKGLAAAAKKGACPPAEGK